MNSESNPYLQHLTKHLNSERLNPPSGYIGWMRTWPRFSDGFLDHLPKKAIIIHDTRVVEHLAILGIDARRQRTFRTGTTDPNLIYVLYSDKGHPEILVNQGLPGGGGMSTQAAELYALGVEEIIHIGTCALTGTDVPPRQIVLSQGAYKDGAAILLSNLSCNNNVEPIVYADKNLNQRLEKALGEINSEYTPSFGYTIGSFYFQPESLIKNLVQNEDLPGEEQVGHIEMEEASLFTVAERMNRKAASLVVASDRYTIEDGRLKHSFEDDFDQDEAERRMLIAASSALGIKLK